MTTSSKWTEEEGSTLVEVVSVGTSRVMVISEVCSMYENQSD